jgi:phosphopantothenoylcysteine decarboxylase / phosphopantothenate---cysteine ligase
MRVMVGVCGSISAYKAPELVRQLQQRGVDVSVAMTRSAKRFVSSITFAALTGRTVYTSLWQPSSERTDDSSSEFSIEHVVEGQDLDALVIAPATANFLAKFASGIANDFLSAMYLATKAPVFIAPAMNVNMWNHPATQANVRILRERGVIFIEPESGYLACGMTGGGRLASVEAIADAVLTAMDKKKDLDGESIIITAGGTRELIDPVRFLGNRSSGKMGYALAEEAVSRGARVILITASALPPPNDCRVIQVETAAQMSTAVLENLHTSTIVIKAAAVADYRVATPSLSKLRRTGPITLDLLPTEDIVAQVVAERRESTLVIAFAAETEELETNARAKLLRKGADAIVVNDVSAPGIGFESDRNAGLFITAGSTVSLPESSKRDMARRILDEVKSIRLAASSGLRSADVK